MGSKWQKIRTLVFVVGTIEDCIGGVQNEGLDWEGVTNVGCQLKLWPFVSWQSTPSWLSKTETEAAFDCLFGGEGGKALVEETFLFSAHPPHFLFSFAAADMWWFVIKKQAKKHLRVFPELWTYNTNVALWHSLWELAELTIHFYLCSYVFKKPGKYHGEADEHSLSTKLDSGKPKSTIMRLVADREKWKPFLVVKLVGQCKRVDSSAERHACCGTKMKAVDGFNRSLNPTSSSITKGDKKNTRLIHGSFYENYSVFDTLIRCDFTFKHYKAFFKYSREKNWQTQWDFFLSIFTHH